MIVAITPVGASGPAPVPTTSTTLNEHTPTTLKVGANTDSSDFFGIFIALAVLIGAIIVIRLAFPSRRRPPPHASAARSEAARRARLAGAEGAADPPDAPAAEGDEAQHPGGAAGAEGSPSGDEPAG